MKLGNFQKGLRSLSSGQFAFFASYLPWVDYPYKVPATKKPI